LNPLALAERDSFETEHPFVEPKSKVVENDWWFGDIKKRSCYHGYAPMIIQKLIKVSMNYSLPSLTVAMPPLGVGWELLLLF
jgi:hypothetical protein